jgi:hypothetical protein
VPTQPNLSMKFASGAATTFSGETHLIQNRPM